ncbi:hypothetical protein HYD68_03720 [Mycoplasmopsis bovis]|nr:hypothetical protein [Mycoplasmopsis bovis]QQH54723.1 hypothetical protein HYD68_03720 [Mycoplasmopsis bovis]
MKLPFKFEIEAKSDEDKIKKEKIEKEKAVAERNKLNDSITVREEFIAWEQRHHMNNLQL